MILAVNRSDALIGFLDYFLTAQGKARLFKVIWIDVNNNMALDPLVYFVCHIRSRFSSLYDSRVSDL